LHCLLNLSLFITRDSWSLDTLLGEPLAVGIVVVALTAITARELVNLITRLEESVLTMTGHDRRSVLSTAIGAGISPPLNPFVVCQRISSCCNDHFSANKTHASLPCDKLHQA